MMRLGMDEQTADRLGALAAQAVEQALKSGLTWDQAIVAFGVASHALAAKAASQGAATPAECDALAEKRLKFGIVHGPEVLKAYLS
jgi:hypothetical protein